MNNVIVSGEQQMDSVIHVHASILPQAPLPSRLPHNVEQRSQYRCIELISLAEWHFIL